METLFYTVLNPDGYEIYEKDYTVIRNPIYRQMLRMQETPSREYICNARGMDLRRNFPTNYYRRQRISQQPASEMKRKLSSVCFRKIPAEAFFLLAIRLKRLSASVSPGLFP